jgi:hypothetical protein
MDKYWLLMILGFIFVPVAWAIREEVGVVTSVSMTCVSYSSWTYSIA